jgi:hypothetical protein
MPKRMPPKVLLNRSVLLTAYTADLADEERGRRSLKVSQFFPVLTVFLSFAWIFLLRLMSLFAADPADGRKEAYKSGSIRRARGDRGWASGTRQREVSFGISLSVRIISTGVLVFTQTSVSLKNFAGTFSIASPTVFTGKRLPFLVVFQS